jgi:bacterioferritin-associated ferredoxin
MYCQRCKGLLVRETFDDLREGTGCMGLATRCINCGYLEDSVMRANRLCPPAAKRAVPRMIVRKGGVVFNTLSERYRSV